MMKVFTLATGLLLGSCNNSLSTSVPNLDDAEWLIDMEYVRQGCFSGKDCIPSLQNPKKSSIDGANLGFLDDQDLVVGIWNGQEYVAYPHPILDWHEIANETNYTISYCPLTGSAIHFEANGEFGVSGLLYNNNLIMYDRNSDSFWPQMFLKSASGDRQGDPLKLKPILETTWYNWKKLFPNSKVVNSNTGFSREYNFYPYGQYKTCNSNNCRDFIYFPLVALDDRLPAKERVLSLITDNRQKAYPIRNFNQPTILNETIDGKKYVVVLSGIDNIAVAFQTDHTLSIDKWDITGGSIILKNSSGKRWNILGHSISSGTTDLKAARAYIAYWFAQAAFYPQTKIHS